MVGPSRNWNGSSEGRSRTCCGSDWDPKQVLLMAELAQRVDVPVMVGIGAAFVRNGRADAVNMGGPKAVGFVVGAEAIGRAVGEGSPTDRSEVEWSADRVLVASTGDLGITFGMIRFHKPQEGQPAAVPFFTIWRRDDPSQPWRYIAE